MLQLIKPMLARLADPEWLGRENSDYLFEVKYDGARCIAQSFAPDTRIWSRSGREMTNNFPEIVVNSRLPVVLDGEIISCDETGKSIFNRVQHRTTRENHVEWAMKEYPCSYEVFDIVAADGKDLTGLPLIARKEILNKLLIPTQNVRIAPYMEDGAKLFAEMELKKWEGVIGKTKGGIYLPGKREWLKVKVGMDEIFHICGYTEGTGWRTSTFGALVLGKLTQKGFQYVGAVGTGFDTAMINSLYDDLKQLPRVSCAFGAPPEPATWVLPAMQCLVHFAEYTGDGKCRFPSFKGRANGT